MSSNQTEKHRQMELDARRRRLIGLYNATNCSDRLQT